MPKLVNLYIRNVIIGFGIAAVFVALLLWLNVMNLWHLLTHSDVGVLAVFMLWFMHGIVFAGVQFAWAVMSLAEKQPTGRGGTPIAHAPQPVLANVENPAQVDPVGAGNWRAVQASVTGPPINRVVLIPEDLYLQVGAR